MPTGRNALEGTGPDERIPSPARFGAAIELYGFLGGAAIGAFLESLGRACRVERVNAPPRGSGYIECFWHEHVICFLAATCREPPRITLFHPRPYLKPMEYYSRWKRWQVAMGSTGHNGKAAAQKVVEALGRGGDFFICPDGPGGPPRVIKPGVLEIARAAQCPIFPLRVSYSARIRIRGWDRKHVALPGSRIRLEYGTPIHPGTDAEAATRALVAQM